MVNLQAAALLALVVPAAVASLAGSRATGVLSAIVAVAAASGMVAYPWAASSARSRRRFGRSLRGLVLAGAALDVLGLLLMAAAPSVPVLALGLVLVTVGQSLGLAAHLHGAPTSALEPGGDASYGVTVLAGAAAGLSLAAFVPLPASLLWLAVVVALGAASQLATLAPGAAAAPLVDAGAAQDTAGPWRLRLAALGDLALASGLTLLTTFVLYFFRDVVGASDPAVGAGLVAALAAVGAMLAGSGVAGFAGGGPPGRLVWVAAVPMVLAACGAALLPGQDAVLTLAVVFGLGYGAVRAAVAEPLRDALPDGVTGGVAWLATPGIPGGPAGVLAPLLGGWLLTRAGPAAGYRALFLVAGGCVAAGAACLSVAVSRPPAAAAPVRGMVRAARPLSPLWAAPVRRLFVLVLAPYLALAYRVRGYGRLPRGGDRRLVLSNHQHDLDTMAVMHGLLRRLPGRHPVFSAASRRLFVPGFMAVRTPWLAAPLRRADFSGLFRQVLGMRPLDDTPLAPPLTSMAFDLLVRFGDRPLGELFDGAALARLGLSPALPLTVLWGAEHHAMAQSPVSLHALREPYRATLRAATRVRIEQQLRELERLLRRGATVYLTPEGRYSADGAVGRLRQVLSRLHPQAREVWLAAISYDPFADRRVSLVYRLAPPADASRLRLSLTAARPVVVSQLLAACVLGAGGSGAGGLEAGAFTAEEARAAVRRRLWALPEGAFIDPALRFQLDRRVNASLRRMVRLGFLVRRDGRYRRGPRRRLRSFPQVDDMQAYQARTLAETERALRLLAASPPAFGVPRPVPPPEGPR